MQNAPVNRNLLITLGVLVVVAVVYFVWSGGFSSVFQSDIPQFVPSETAEPAPATAGGAAGPGTPAIAPGAAGAPAMAPSGGSGQPSGSPAMGPSGAGGAPPAVAPGAEPATPAGEQLTSEEKVEKLEAFRKIDSREILQRRIEEARSNETVVNAEENLPYSNVGRVDPLFIVNDAIPEELRPPRTGETDYDKILELLIAEERAALLESVRIEVWSVMRIGLYDMVNLSVDGALMTVQVGYTVQMRRGAYSFTVTSASQEMVTIVLQSGDITKTRSFVPKSY